MKNLSLYIIIILSLQSFKTVWSQNLTTADSSILKFLSEEQAFLLWQENWKKRLPEFDLTAFKFKEEKKLTEQFKDSTSIEKIRSRGHLALTLFSPNGLRAVNPMSGSTVLKKNGYYELYPGHNYPLKLYDFITNTSFSILFISRYGPGIAGMAWLTNALLVAVGERFDLSGKFDKVAPAVMIFDLNKMNRRILIGDFINALDYYKTRRYGERPLVEPRLMYQFQGKNQINSKIKKKEK